MSISLQQKIAELKREIALRKAVYPGFIARGKLKQPKADEQIEVLTAVLHDYLAQEPAPPEEEKIVFGVGDLERGGAPVVTVGLPRGAWLYMRDGKTHTLDLERIGIPFRLMMFGCETHVQGIELLKGACAASATPVKDLRGLDVSLQADAARNPSKAN